LVLAHSAGGLANLILQLCGKRGYALFPLVLAA
jgi:hypothetical protein